MSSNIRKLTPSVLKRIIAEEKQRLVEIAERKKKAEKKKLLEAFRMYKKVESSQKNNEKMLRVLKKYIKSKRS